MNQACDKIGFSDQKRHKSTSRRRWSGELSQHTDFSAGWVSRQVFTKNTKAPRQFSKLTKKESANVAKLLQLQSENFVRTLEVQSLRYSVTELLNARNKADEAFRLFQNELKGLERGVVPTAESALDYELSESDWQEIIER